jgi:hypothetical protein
VSQPELRIELETSSTRSIGLTEAHSQAILECCRLGLDGGRIRVRSCETSPEWHRKTSGAASKALREVQSESPGRHEGEWGEGGGVE